MILETLDALSRAKAWSEHAPRYGGEYAFGPEDAEPVVFGVFGDSVGCGLGVSRVERTFAGDVSLRLARERRVLCRIRAVSGARGKGLALQGPSGDERFAAVSIGTNDILHGESLAGLERAVSAFLDRLRGAERVVVLGPGALDASAIVPSLLRPAVRLRMRACEGALCAAVARFPNARHFGPRDFRGPFSPAFFAPDGFHPSELAHGLIAEAVFDRLTAPRNELD